MRKSWLFVYPLAALALWFLLQILSPGQRNTVLIYAGADGEEGDFHFPAVFAPENTPTPTPTTSPTPTGTPTPTPTATATKTPNFSSFVNGSFEDCIEGVEKCEWPTIPYPEMGQPATIIWLES